MQNKGWYSTTVKRSKDLLACTDRHDYQSALQASTYNVHSVSLHLHSFLPSFLSSLSFLLLTHPSLSSCPLSDSPLSPFLFSLYFFFSLFLNPRSLFSLISPFSLFSSSSPLDRSLSLFFSLPPFLSSYLLSLSFSLFLSSLFVVPSHFVFLSSFFIFFSLFLSSLCIIFSLLVLI